MIVQALKDYFIHLGLERRASEATLRAYEGDIGQFVGFLREELGREPGFGNVDGLAVRSFLGRLSREGYSKRSIARKVASLRSFFGHCVKRGLCPADPTIGVSAPRSGRSLPIFASVQAMERMMNLPPLDTRRGMRDRAVLELLYGTGMRLSELVGCTVGRCDFSRGVITVLGKRNKERMLPLQGKGAEYLKLYLENRFGASESIWTNRESFFGFFGEALAEPLIAGRGEGTREPPHDSTDRSQVSRGYGSSLAHEPARAPAHLRDASSRRGGGPESRSGASRARESLNDADLHPRNRGPAAGSLRKGSPARLRRRGANKGFLGREPRRHYLFDTRAGARPAGRLNPGGNACSRERR